MIEKTLPGLFKVVTEEAAANPAFARRLEDALGKFAEDYVESRRAERVVGDFHPLIEYKKMDSAEFLTRPLKFDARELRLLIAKHNLDPAATLRPKAAKKALAQHILDAAQKRAERDAKLFSY